MTLHANESRPVDPPRHPMTPVRDSSRGWILGAVAVFAVLGLIVWSMSNNTVPTASDRTDINTGSATRTAPATPVAPAPAPATTPARP